MEVFLLFALYSFFGCVLEDAYFLLLHRRYVSKRTLLNLPLCPVYGVAAIVLMSVNGDTQNPIILFINGFLTVSAVELSFFLVSEKMYNIRWWDYSGYKLNFMGGICIFYSVIWGVLNIIFAKALHPAVNRWISGFSDAEGLLWGLFLAIYIFADFKETHKELVKHKNGEVNRIFEKFVYLKRNN